MPFVSVLISQLELAFCVVVIHITIRAIYFDIERLHGPELALAFQLFFCWCVVSQLDFLRNQQDIC